MITGMDVKAVEADGRESAGTDDVGNLPVHWIALADRVAGHIRGIVLAYMQWQVTDSRLMHEGRDRRY